MTLADLASRIGRDIKALRDGKVSTDDARLTDARTPTTHTHPVADVDGLQAALDQMLTGTGSVTITTGVEGIDGGSIAVQRFGPIVYMNILALQLNAETGDLIGVVPAWARPPATIDLTIPQPSASFAAGPVRVYSNGNIRFYNRTGSYIAGLVSYPTAHPYPDL